jgi:predicted TPR repeat methyltransferase
MSSWAQTYNETFINANKYVYPRAVAELFAKYVSEIAITAVVDIGCGTAAVGSYLANSSARARAAKNPLRGNGLSSSGLPSAAAEHARRARGPAPVDQSAESHSEVLVDRSKVTAPLGME